MKSYLDILAHIMANGNDRTDRTGVGTRSVFGYQWRHDMSTGFPLLTTKKVHVKSVIHELLWFLRGETNVKSLQAAGVTIWDEWADEDGELGPVYGKQWRDFGSNNPPKFGVDQIAELIKTLRSNPDSRRMIVSAWNPQDVPHMALPPCHTLFQCYVRDLESCRPRLDLHLYARSIDTFLGLPFNIASYGFLLSMLAHVVEMDPGELIISFGDLHIYHNHFAQAELQLSREPRPLPTLKFAPIIPHRAGLTIDDFDFGDFIIEGYDPHPAIKAPIAV